MDKHNFLSAFSQRKPILAMLHLRGETRQEKFEHALLEAGLLIGGGADAVIVENYFGDYEDMEAVLQAFSREKVDFVYGVNALHNDALGFELAKNTAPASSSWTPLPAISPPTRTRSSAGPSTAGAPITTAL